MSLPVPQPFLSLSAHDWSIVTNRWARGVDWCVEKRGRTFHIGSTFGTWPPFPSRKRAFNALTEAVLAESRRRAAIDSAAAESATASGSARYPRAEGLEGR